LRTAMAPPPACLPGIHVSAKLLLEGAIVLLGFSLSAASILAAGPVLLAGIAGVVAVAVPASYGIGRALGLKRRMAMLVACGNSICGNSAIAAVAPVIGADGQDIAASIAFTAVLGVAVVLGLPALTLAIGLPAVQGGMFAGLTVYAVPQVLAAAAPLGATAVQMGTLVKLVRVMMLGPVVLVLSLLTGRRRGRASDGPGVSLRHMLPWFIVGFALAIGARSAGIVPACVLPGLAGTASALTIVSMAALGLSTDMRAVARAGLRVSAAVMLSLAMLGAISLALILGLSG
jgi:uncharacterized integral membrane protein (TIGR00698 family)